MKTEVRRQSYDPYGRSEGRSQKRDVVTRRHVPTSRDFSVSPILRASLSVYCLLSTSLYAGWYSAEILSLPAGPRAQAMGTAYTAIADDPFALWWNPSGTIKNKLVGADSICDVRAWLSFMQIRPFEIENFSFITTGYSREKIAIAIATATLAIDKIPELPETLVVNPIGYFNDKEFAFILSVAGKVKNMLIGTNIKHIRYDLYETQAQGTGIDFGLSSKIKNILLGLTVKDIGGTSIKWETGQKDFKQTSISIGTAYETIENLLISADLKYEYKLHYAIGGEYSIKDMLYLRSGVNCFNELNTDYLTYCAGIGIKVRNLTVDYSFATHNLNNTHQISSTLSF